MHAGAVRIANLTPDQDYTVPYNSNENITYKCEVESGKRVVWTIITPEVEVIDIQLVDNQSKMIYENKYGLIVEDNIIQLNESRLHVTQMARIVFRELLESPQLEIGCFPLATVTTFPKHTIITFGKFKYV